MGILQCSDPDVYGSEGSKDAIGRAASKEAGADSDEFELDGGSWFGESCLFEEGFVRMFTAFAASESELTVLAASDYHHVCTSNPEMQLHHKEIERALSSGKLNMAGLSCMAQRENEGSRNWMFSSQKI